MSVTINPVLSSLIIAIPVLWSLNIACFVFFFFHNYFAVPFKFKVVLNNIENLKQNDIDATER